MTTATITEDWTSLLHLIARAAAYQHEPARKAASTADLMAVHVFLVDRGEDSAAVLGELERRAAL